MSRDSLLSTRPHDAAATFPPFVEVEVVYAPTLPSADRERWRAFEIWTRHSLYVLDAQMRCIEVVDRSDGQVVANHTFEGATLIGAQVPRAGTMELCVPWPRPGFEAVFLAPSSGRYMTTSTVERVVLRLLTVTVPNAHLMGAWERLIDPHAVATSHGR